MSETSEFHTENHWRAVYWLYASLPGLVLFGFEAAQLLLFEATRAPNVTVTVQLGLMGVFFLLFALVPRLVWWVAHLEIGRGGANPLRLVPGLVVLGLALSAVHLLVLASFLRFMYSPPGWGLSALAGSFLEVWLGEAGIWLMVYGFACAVVVRFLQANDAPTMAPERVEVRHGIRTHSLCLQDIIWIESCGNYVELHSRRGNFLLRKPLATLESEFAEAGFLRSHRRALVNAAHVEAIRSEPAGGYLVELTGKHLAPLSRRKVAPFRQLLAGTPAMTSASIPQH